MNNPDFRALCAELINHLQVRVSNEDRVISTVGYYSQSQQLLDRARAALAQPEPVAGESTDEELLRTYGLAKRDYCYDGPSDDWPKRAERAATIHGLRAVLARWGAPAIEPVPVSERPWQREGWLDAEGSCWMGDPGDAEFIPSWRLCRPEDAPSMTCSLPYWALPMPTPANTTREEI